MQRFVPDLAIEVVSGNDRFNAVLTKALRYVRCGTEEAWQLSIEHRQAYLYTPRGARVFGESDEFATDLIPGFSIRRWLPGEQVVVKLRLVDRRSKDRLGQL